MRLARSTVAGADLVKYLKGNGPWWILVVVFCVGCAGVCGYETYTLVQRYLKYNTITNTAVREKFVIISSKLASWICADLKSRL